jgi:hypothetical protein
MEVRGVGIVEWLAAGTTPVGLIVRLDREVPRLPEPARRDIAGVAVPEIALDPFAASTPIKVELALRRGLPA